MTNCSFTVTHSFQTLKKTTTIRYLALNNFPSFLLPDQALRVLREQQMASVMMDCGRRLLQEVYDAQLQMSRPANEAVGVRNSRKL